MRGAFCPICHHETDLVLQLRFPEKLNLPVDVGLRHCERDNFVFISGCSQADYDQYYATTSDTMHRDVSPGSVRSAISAIQSEELIQALDGFFDMPRKVLDFGCGEGSLLVEMATAFPSARFFGYEPGTAAKEGSAKAKDFGLPNLCIGGLQDASRAAPYDLIILSHVAEHLIDLDLFAFLRTLLATDGTLYVEVPNALQYHTYPRLEFLYYFDRLHVNHFTPQALARIAAGCGLGCMRQFEYAFPYRDGEPYPALGMLFANGGNVRVASPPLMATVTAYIAHDQERARSRAGLLSTFEGVLVWGAGDNFFRSMANGGPLSPVRNIVLLDRRSVNITIGGRSYQTIDPAIGIDTYSWPVVVTIASGRAEIARQVTAHDPGRRVIFL